jgi:hypothetical protein
VLTEDKLDEIGARLETLSLEVLQMSCTGNWTFKIVGKDCHKTETETI